MAARALSSSVSARSSAFSPPLPTSAGVPGAAALSRPGTRRLGASPLVASSSPSSSSLLSSRPYVCGQKSLFGFRRVGRSRVSCRAERDLYEVLGISRDADKKAIKAAYRKLARQYHPDVNKEAGAEQRFKDVSRAYEVLSDPEKKKLYDQFGEAGLGGGAGMGGGMGGMGGGMGGFGAASNPFDVFEQFFGGGGFHGGRQGASRGRASPPPPEEGDDRRADLVLPFEDACFGCSREVRYDRLESCGTCGGSGHKPGSEPTRCTLCGGSGQRAEAVQTPLGVFQQIGPCPRCHGTGEAAEPCPTCRGRGRVKASKTLTVRVPPGVDTGARLRVRGEGDAGLRGGPPGDLYAFLRVKPPPAGLRREGEDVRSEVRVPCYDAILGSTVRVHTIDGDVSLRIPPGTQPNATLALHGKGVPRLGAKGRGDHLVTVKVTVPRDVGDEERALVEDLKSLREGGRPAPRPGAQQTGEPEKSGGAETPSGGAEPARGGARAAGEAKQRESTADATRDPSKGHGNEREDRNAQRNGATENKATEREGSETTGSSKSSSGSASHTATTDSKTSSTHQTTTPSPSPRTTSSASQSSSPDSEAGTSDGPKTDDDGKKGKKKGFASWFS